MSNQDLKNLREDLVGELKAINDYQSHIDATQNEAIKKVLSHIRDEEKEHVVELIRLLQEFDEIQGEKFKEEAL